MNIKIKKMEYEYMSVLVSVLERKNINTSIRVEFTIGDVECLINIPIEEVHKMDEDKVMKYIYNYLNNKLERKFIDEI